MSGINTLKSVRGRRVETKLVSGVMSWKARGEGSTSGPSGVFMGDKLHTQYFECAQYYRCVPDAELQPHVIMTKIQLL